MNLRSACFLATTLLTAALYGQAGRTAAAPVPPAIAAAKKVFISNAGEDDLSGDLFSKGPSHSYNEFYHQVQARGRYELVSMPEDADLILEISVEVSPMPAADGYGSKYSPVVARLRILDPKTHVILWAFYEHVERANLKRTWDRYLDRAISRLAADLNSIAGSADSPKP